jgi:hypothetical protein
MMPLCAVEGLKDIVVNSNDDISGLLKKSNEKMSVQICRPNMGIGLI